MNLKEFQSEYDLKKFCTITPQNRLFKMLVAPRYLHHYCQNAYEDFTADILLNNAKDGMLFIDNGAHYGFYNLLVATQLKKSKILAFEPAPENYEILKTNIKINKLENVEVHNLAVSNKDETKRFNITEASDSCGFYQHSLARTAKEIEVKTVTLDKFIKDIPKIPTIIKVDTEGYEICVLEGMRNILRNIEDIKLILEFNPKMLKRAGFQPEKLLKEVNQLGFDIYFIKDEQREIYKLSVSTLQDWHKYLSEEGYMNILCARKQKSLSVCFFSHTALLGGAERCLLELVTELIRDHGVICSVVLPSDGPLRKKLDQVGASTLIFEYVWWCSINLRTSQEIARRFNDSFRTTLGIIREKIEKINPDIVSTNTMVIPWGAVIASTLNKPHVWFVHEFGVLDHGLKFYLPFRQILKIIRDSSNIICTNSDAVRKVLFGDALDGNILTIRYHIDIAPDQLIRDKDVYFSKVDATRIIISSAIGESKGQKDAILAVRELVRKRRNVELVILGYSAARYLEELKDLVEKEGLEEDIRFHGYKENIFSIVNQADVVLMCSRNEAFGRVTLEAMLLKKPVLGTNSGGTPELIKEGFNGLLYKPGDYEELAAKIEYLMENREKMKEFGENGFKFAKENFTKEEFGGKFYQLLQNVKNTANPSSSSYLDFVTKLMYDNLTSNTKLGVLAKVLIEAGLTLRSVFRSKNKTTR